MLSVQDLQLIAGGLVGYTHYVDYRPQAPIWRRMWPSLLNDAQTLIVASGIEVAGWDGTGRYELSAARIGLNGAAAFGCETFDLQGPGQVASDRLNGSHFDGSVWSFCKTRREAYDAVVGAILIRASQLAPEDIVFSSDGSWDQEWKFGAGTTSLQDALIPSARELCEYTFGRDTPSDLCMAYFEGQEWARRRWNMGGAVVRPEQMRPPAPRPLAFDLPVSGAGHP